MLTRRPTVVAMLLTSWFLGTEARAQENAPAVVSSQESASDSVWERKVSLYGQVAPTGGPVGVFGASVDWAPVPILSFELGVGLGAGSPPHSFGVQGALLGHLKPIRGEKWALTLGAGPSVGDYGTTVWTIDQTDGALRYRPAAWANGEIGTEARFKGGFTWRSAVGVSRMLNPGVAECHTSFCYTGGQSPTTLLYLSFGFGFAIL